MIARFLYIILLLAFCHASCSQGFPIDDGAISARYPFVHSVFNRIQNASGLDSFYKKIKALKQTGTGKVSIVHIGDSHLQAGFISGVMRKGLQDYFGNAGRGIIFPYQLAESNAPDDISSSSNTRWQYNRIAHPEIPIRPGVSGFVIRSNNPDARIRLNVSQDSFNRIQLFTGNNSWQYKKGDEWVGVSDNSSLIILDSPANAIELNNPTTDSAIFYGASLENGNPGILYHSIGVNGSRYDQYNIAPLFWQQLPALKADLYIISLGTNEAQRVSFNDKQFTDVLDEFIQRLRASSPGASIIITTAADNYKARKSNLVLKQLNQSLVTYCNKNRIPLWDLYQATNGYGSANSWMKRGLMNRDRIHFTAEGYQLQGRLLLNALMKAFE